ncbi:MAG: hypothetical protein J6U40_04280, partial [Kiritimatiellae bacterium]|nr:hypothetical protein [Kiritimatiellia bacterium]
YAVTRTDEGVFTTYQGRNDGTLNWAAAPFDAFVFKTGFPFCIGQDGTGEYSKKFVGAVDDFALWTRGMTHEEIRSIYECGRAGMPLADLLAIDANDAPTMAVTALDTDSCTLTFGGRRTRTFQLCVASGVADAAGDKYAWETFTLLAAITPDQTAYTYTIPETFKQNRAKFRFFLLQTDDLPYVQEVQHVQSGGGAFIDTGIAPRRTLSATFDIQLTEQNGKWDWMFGAMGTTDKNSNFGIARFQDNGYWHIEVSGDNQRPYLCTLNEPHHVVFTPAVITMDGQSHTSGTTASTFIESGWTINLFRNLKMGAPYDQTMRGWYTAFTLATPKRTARDFTPVTDGEGTAGLFDAVTGRFLASGGDPLAAGEGQDPARFGWVRAQSETFNANTDVPDTAGWVGAGDITDLVDPANWACTNRFGKPLPGALPTAETTLLVGGPTTFAVPAGKMPTCKAILFDNAQLTADADWCGLDFDKVLPESVIDLDGYRLTLAGPDGETAAPFTITDASTDADAPGELHIIVAEGANYVNSGIRFNGNLRLVKEGTGTYSSTFNAHTYSGGTYVAEGTVRPSTTVNRQFGLEGSTIQVAKGATLDIWSRYFSRYAIQLDGGTLTNTYNPMTANADADIGNLTLTDDARFVFADITKTHDITVATGSVWNLGGHTLTLSLDGNDPDFTVNNGVVISNGTLIIDVVRTDGRGWLQNKGLIGKDGLNLDLGVSPLRLKGNSSVFDFTTRSPHADVHSAEGCTLDIYGTFTPDSAYGFNMRMMNGSTLNLTGKTEPWPTLFSQNTSYNNCTLGFESGATVTVDLHGRVFGGLRTQILSWPEPPEHVTFRFDPETAAFYTPHADAEGLWIVPTGIVIFLK